MLAAPINFIAPMKEKPTYYMNPSPGVPEENMTYVEHVVSIGNAREITPSPSLDHEGFVLLTHQTAVPDLYDVNSVTAIYYRELETLVKHATNAKTVVAFDWNIRSSRTPGSYAGTPARQTNNDDSQVDPESIQAPVRSAHNDYTDKSGPQRVIDVMGKHNSRRLLQNRYAIINVWKPIHGPVKQIPLAVCDARTIKPGQLLDSDIVYADRIGEVSMLTHDPEQQWYYVPEMLSTEVLLIKGFDSELGQARFTAHSAFDDPTSDTTAPPRESIEVRTLAFF
jgi:hypothetical protein